MARYLPNIVFVIAAGVETGLLATGDQLSHGTQIAWIGTATIWAILAGLWQARSRG